MRYPFMLVPIVGCMALAMVAFFMAVLADKAGLYVIRNGLCAVLIGLVIGALFLFLASR